MSDADPIESSLARSGAVEVTVWDRHGDARQAWHERSDS